MSVGRLRRDAGRRQEWFDAECGWICKEPCFCRVGVRSSRSNTAEGFAELLAERVDVVLAGVVHGLADDKHNVCFGANP